MPTNMKIEERLAALASMSTAELRREWRAVFGEDPRSGNVPWMRKRLAGAIQAQAYGGLSEAAQRRIDELAPVALAWMPIGRRAFPGRNDTVSPAERGRAALKPGTTITRRYKGRTLVASVREDGVEFDGSIYTSLTAAAKAATGSHWNGPLFWLGRARDRKSA